MAELSALLARLGLDEAVVEYVRAALDEESDTDQLREIIVPLLQDSTTPEDGDGIFGQIIALRFGEEAAASKSAAQASAPAAAAEESGPRKLGQSICMVDTPVGHVDTDLATLPSAQKGKLQQVSSSAAGKGRKREAKAAAGGSEGRMSAAEQEMLERDFPLVEATSQVSRFHVDLEDTEAGEVDLKDVSLDVAGTILLQGARIQLFPGRRYGLVGRNGVGKSTLLRQMAAGTIGGWPRNLVTLLVEQEDVGDARSALETVLQSNFSLVDLQTQEKLLQAALDKHPNMTKEQARMPVLEMRMYRLRAALEEQRAFYRKLSRMRMSLARTELLKLEKDEETLAATLLREGTAEEMQHDWLGEFADMHADIHDQLRNLDSEESVGRATRILKGLGLTPDMIAAQTQTLSGGWRMRVALARSLYAEPHILLLDEPTNHLDIRAVLWLENHILSQMEDTVVVIVSHDREFLDSVTTDTICFKSKRLNYFDGNYSEFEEFMAQKAIDDQRKQEAIDKKRDKFKEQAERMTREAKKSGNDKQAKQAASRRRKLERVGLERNAKGHKFKLNRDRVGYFLSVRGDVDMDAGEDDVELPIVAGENLGYNGPVLQLDNVSVGYDPASPVIKGVTLDIDMNSRIGFLGENGAGKSTLLATIAGKLQPLSGALNRYGRLRVGYYSQHSVDSLPMEDNSVRHLMTTFPGTSEQEARAHLGSMGLSGSLAVQPIRTLSGGQRCRLSIALLAFVPPHILLLDEPTNHLDLQAIVGLAEALADFEGGIVLVSHDRRLIREIVETHYWVKDGKMLPLGADGLDVFLDSMTKGMADPQ